MKLEQKREDKRQKKNVRCKTSNHNTIKKTTNSKRERKEQRSQSIYLHSNEESK